MTTAPMIGGGAATPDGTPRTIDRPAPPPTTPDVLRHAAELLRDRSAHHSPDRALWLAAGADRVDLTGWADSPRGDVVARYSAACNALIGRCGGMGVPQIAVAWVRSTDDAAALLDTIADDLERTTR
jgi:hypothetical protein